MSKIECVDSYKLGDILQIREEYYRLKGYRKGYFGFYHLLIENVKTKGTMYISDDGLIRKVNDCGIQKTLIK